MPEYALILLFLFIGSLTLHRGFKVKLFKSLAHATLTYTVVAAAAVIWDTIAIARGHWSFGKEFLLGPKIGLMPIEEYFFVLVVGYFGLVIYKIIEKLLKK